MGWTLYSRTFRQCCLFRRRFLFLSSRDGATLANFPGHTISPAGVSPDGDKVRALSHIPDPTNAKQGLNFKLTMDIADIVTGLLRELSQPLVLVFPD